MKLKVNVNVIQENIMKDFGFEKEKQDDLGSKIEVF